MSGIIGTVGARSGIVGESKDTAKVWLRMDTSNHTIDDDFGVSTVEQHSNGTGYHTVNYTSNFKNINYAVVATCQNRGVVSIDASFVGSIRIRTHYDGDSNHNYPQTCLVIFSN